MSKDKNTTKQIVSVEADQPASASVAQKKLWCPQVAKKLQECMQQTIFRDL